MKKLMALMAIAGASVCTADTVTLKSEDPGGKSSFIDGARWSNSVPPTSDNDYVVASGLGMRTPQYYVQTSGVTTNAVFAGDSLTLGDGSSSGKLVVKTTAETRYKGCASVTVGDLRLANANSYVQHAGNCPDTRLCGKITFSVPQASITDSAVPYLTGNEYRYLDVYSELVSAAGCGFKVRLYDGTKPFHVALMSDNPSYLGYIASEGDKVYLTAESAVALGPEPETRTALLNLRNGGAFGVEYNDVTINQPKRGIYISSASGGRLYAASGKTFQTSMFIESEATPRPVEKTGDGTVLVTGAYGAGDITVSGGRLGLDGAVSRAVTVSDGCSFGPATADSRLTLSGAITFNGSAHFYVPLGAVTELADGFTSSVWPIPLEMGGDWTDAATTVTVFRVASSVHVFAEAELAALSAMCGIADGNAFHFIASTDGGVQTVSCVKSTVVNETSNDTGVYANWGNANIWDSKKVPESGYTYVVGKGKTCRSNYGGLDGSAAFTGDRLEFDGSSDYSSYAKFVMKAKTVAVPRLAMSGKTEINVAGYSGASEHHEQTLNGSLYMFPESYCVVNSSWDRLLTLNAPLFGAGTIHLVPIERDTSVIGKSNSHKNEMRVALAADNSAWLGSLILSAKPDSYNGDVPTDGNEGIVPVELIIADGSNVGGNPATYDENSFRISARCRLTATNTLELSCANRPVKVEQYAEMCVADGKTMTITSPLILNGTLTKSGAGTLALGCHAAASTANTISLAEGFLAASTTNGFNGVTVAVSSGAAIKVPLQADATTDLGRFGFCNTGTDEPFDLTDCGATLAIAVSDEGGRIAAAKIGGARVSVNVLTVSAAAADSLEGRIEVHSEDGWEAMKTIRNAADAAGRVTFTSAFHRRGLIISMY